MDEKNPEAFYARLKEQLELDANWPSIYLFKFIVPTNDEKIATIHSIFNNLGAVIKLKQSKAGKYTSVSINVRMQNPTAVIEKYLAVGKIEGVISL